MSNSAIPEDIKERNPTITAAGLKMLRRLQEDRHAPLWNHRAGDRLSEEDLKSVSIFRTALARNRKLHAQARASESDAIPEHIIDWVMDKRKKVPLFRDRVPLTDNLSSVWTRIPSMSREDIATRPEYLVPDDADLKKLIVYRTAGTTGHALLVPHSALSAAKYRPLKELALEQYDIRPEFNAENVACFLVCAQARTVTYATILADWQEAGFAKLNLSLPDWPAKESPALYFESMQPQLLTGDPISFSEMMRLDIKTRPLAMISTAVAMSPSLKERLQTHYNCPVIDWYSLTETGPIAYACKHGFGYHILPDDIFVEAIDKFGQEVPLGQTGEITVTGGRNPYLPLLRYRTGDWGRLELSPCSCGDTSPRLFDLEGRQPVLFRNSTGAAVNPVDISGVLRNYPLVQHEFCQQSDLSCNLELRPIAGANIDDESLKKELSSLFGPAVKITIDINDRLGSRLNDQKLLPFRSEFLLED